MKRTTLAISGMTAAALVTVLVLLFSYPIGRFLQSNLFQSAYVSRDHGIYLGKEVTVATGKQLKIDQGVMLRAASTKVGNTNVVDVYVTVMNEQSDFTPDSLKGVVSYNRDALTLKDISSGVSPLAGTILDDQFTQILRNTDGTESGTLYVGIERPTPFVKPSEEVLKLRFEAKSSSVLSSAVSMDTVRVYKKEDLFDAAKPTLFLTRNEGDKTVVEAVPVLFDGSRVDVVETQVTGGGIQKVEKHYDKAGAIVKTVTNTTNAAGKLVSVETVLADGSKNQSSYVYDANGTYTVTNTSLRANGEVIVATTSRFDKNGAVMPSVPANTTQMVTAAPTTSMGATTPTTSTGTTIANTGAPVKVTTGVTSAVTSTTTTAGSTVTGQTATTSAACTPEAGERFNDTVGHWSENVVEQARQKCIISGKSLGRFAPDEPVTRAELTKIAVEAFKVSQSTGNIGFADVSDTEWYASYIRAAKAAAIVGGYNDGTFKPNNQVNRAEALKIILEAGVKTNASRLSVNLDNAFTTWLNQNPTYTYVRFPDVKVADWFGKYVYTGAERGVVGGYKDRGVDVFRPAQPVTRAEAVKMIMSIVQ